MSDDVPRPYRHLLAAHSPDWRRAHGEVTLATLLELHAAQGRSAPSARERAGFLLAGLRTRLPGGTRRRPLPARRPLPVVDALRFDQENGATPPPSDELDARGARRDRSRNTGTSDAALTPGGTPLRPMIGGPTGWP